MNTNPKKKTVKNVGRSQDFDAQYPGNTSTIQGALDWLFEVQKRGATHIRWGGSVNYDNEVSSIEAQAFYEEEETDAAYAARIEAEAAAMEERRKIAEIEMERRERKEFNRLKKKYGKN